jgi:hypothetical protein
MLGIAGTGTRQSFSILTTINDFTQVSPDWKYDINGNPIFDRSSPPGPDFQFAVQCSPALVMNGSVIRRGAFDSAGNVEVAWARTAFGKNSRLNKVWVVVADGEGINGGHGASFSQMGEFFKNVLGATDAMNFDGGLSTEMVLRDANGRRNVNTLTGEDPAYDAVLDPTVEGEVIESDLGPGGTPIGGAVDQPGSVFSYLSVGI